MRISSPFRTPGVAAVAVFALSLAGCVTLLPREKPVQLYRFEFAETEAPPGLGQPGARFAVRTAPIDFDRPSAGDRILTVQRDGAAYIGGARWVSPAASLFESALERAFASKATRSRLLASGEPTLADYVLKLDVRRFEVRYRGGAPEVRVEVYAALVTRANPQESASRIFSAETTASSNSMHAITAAFDDSVTKSLADLVSWVDAKGLG